jgi:hypothetical protein
MMNWTNLDANTSISRTFTAQANKNFKFYVSREGDQWFINSMHGARRQVVQKTVKKKAGYETLFGRKVRVTAEIEQPLDAMFRTAEEMASEIAK